MIILFVLSLSLCVGITLGLAGESLAWRKDKVCGHKLKTENEEIAGCFRAYCAKTSPSSRICACMLADESDEAKILIEHDGKVIRRWNVTLYPPAGPAAFRVDMADLTGNGKEDLLVATMASESQGIGIQHWEVRAVVDNTVSNAVPVDDYGIVGFATHDKKNKRCSLLAAQWLSGWEPERGSGLYLFGRWFDFSSTSAELYPAVTRPAIYRRYLYSFEQMRLSAMERAESAPLLWFTGADTKQMIGPYPKYEWKGGRQINKGEGE